MEKKVIAPLEPLINNKLSLAALLLAVIEKDEVKPDSSDESVVISRTKTQRNRDKRKRKKK